MEYSGYKQKVVIGGATLYQADCMEMLKQVPDNYYSLSICDPPYGIGKALVAGGTWSVKYQKKGAEWDVTPEKKYFDELCRVSKNQIIWGGNYFTEFIKPARCFIAWVKPNMSGMHTMADCELALTSFDRNAKVINLSSQSNEERVHVCQKPVMLYKKVLEMFAKDGDRILDTHHGSGSLSIACLDMGYQVTAYEIDAEYFKASVERIHRSQQQCKLFDTGATWQQAEKVTGELSGSLFA